MVFLGFRDIPPNFAERGDWTLTSEATVLCFAKQTERGLAGSWAQGMGTAFVVPRPWRGCGFTQSRREAAWGELV